MYSGDGKHLSCILIMVTSSNIDYDGEQLLLIGVIVDSCHLYR
jgi:hypothetical protein